MNQELKEIEVMLHELYIKNLNFLNEKYTDLYEKIEKLSKEIELGTRSEKYVLEMRDEGYFDIKNLENNGYFYASNSYQDAESRAKYNDFTVNSSWDLLRRTPDNKYLTCGESFKDVLPIVQYINEKVDLENIEYREIFKMVFIGTGLGLHINEIYKKLNPKAVLIIEPELEIFRLSLFIIDYSQFIGTNKMLFLSIEDDEKERRQVYQSFRKYQEYLNFNIKHYRLLENYSYIKDEITNYLSGGGAVSFPYKYLLQNLHVTLELIRDKEKFYDFHLAKKQKPFKDKKVLLISAGPSLESYLDWIYENQDKFIIICVEIVVRRLEAKKIIPDIVTAIDPHPTLMAEYIKTEDPNFLKNSAMVIFTQLHESFFEAAKNTNIYCFQSLPIIEELPFVDSGGNVGTFCLVVAYALGVEEFYLIGNDAALDQKTGLMYSDDIEWLQQSISMETSTQDANITIDDTIEVKGNFRDTVKTTRLLISFKDQYEKFFNSIPDNDHKIYNLSDGAYINGMEPLSRNCFEQKSKKFDKQKKTILLDLDKAFRIVEGISFSEDTKLINTILRKITRFKKNSFKNRDDFLQNKLDLMIFVIESCKKFKNKSLFLLFMQFTELADQYVNFVLNLKQKDLHSKEEINKIALMWSNGVYNLFKDIKKATS